jgi:hypothetical protein
VRVKLSKRAENAVTRIDARWLAGADHPHVFLTEMEQVVEHLETVSAPGTPCPTKKRPQLKRILLEKSKCHVYFEINKRKDLINVVTVWDGRRERAPKL